MYNDLALCRAQARYDAAEPPESPDPRLDDFEVADLVAAALGVDARHVRDVEPRWDDEGDGYVWEGEIVDDERDVVARWSCDDETGDVLVLWGAA